MPKCDKFTVPSGAEKAQRATAAWVGEEGLEEEGDVEGDLSLISDVDESAAHGTLGVCVWEREGEREGKRGRGRERLVPVLSCVYVYLCHVCMRFCQSIALLTHVLCGSLYCPIATERACTRGTYTHIHIYTCTHVHMYTCTHTHIHIYTYTYIHIYAYTHIRIYTHTHITHTHTHTHTHTQGMLSQMHRKGEGMKGKGATEDSPMKAGSKLGSPMRQVVNFLLVNYFLLVN